MGSSPCCSARVRVYEGRTWCSFDRGRITPFLVELHVQAPRRRGHPRHRPDRRRLLRGASPAARRRRRSGTPQFTGFIESLPVALAVQLSRCSSFGAYRGVWRFFGMMDGVVIGKAVVARHVRAVGSWSTVGLRLSGLARAVFVIYAALMMLLATGSRASFRLMSEFIRRRRQGQRHGDLRRRRRRAARAARARRAGRQGPYGCLGFIDDDPKQAPEVARGLPGARRLREARRSWSSAAQVDRIVVSTKKARRGEDQRDSAAGARAATVVLSRLNCRSWNGSRRRRRSRCGHRASVRLRPPASAPRAIRR